MLLPKLATGLALAYGIGTSQQIRLGGVVKDSLTSRPIGGVQVRLLNADSATATDKSGSFSFGSAATGGARVPAADAPGYAVRNGSLTLRLPDAAKVSIRAYSLDGKAVASAGGDWSAGEYSIPSPVTATGTYFYRVRIGDAGFSFKVARLDEGRGVGPGGSHPIGTGSRLPLAKRSAQGPITDTLWFKMEGYASKKVPVAETDLGLEVSLRPISLPGGVRPGVWTGMTDQYTAFALYVAPDGKAVDSLVLKVIMKECAELTVGFSVIGPFPIPTNGALSIGDSVTIAFSDSSVSGTFSSKRRIQVEASPPCQETQIYNTGGGTIIQIVPRYNQNFTLDRRVPFESRLMELIVNTAHGTVKKDPDHPLYFPGEKVKLTAVPDTLFAVTGWRGASSVLSENEATVDMNGPRTVTLEYTPYQGLTVPRAAGGTVTKLGWYRDTQSGRLKLAPDLSPVPYESFWHPGDTLIFIPAAKPTYRFTGWSGDVHRRSGDTAWVIMGGPRTLTPEFETVYTLTINGVNGGVTQIPLKPYFTAGSNDTVMLVAHPISGFRFEGWSGPVYRSSRDTAWVIMDASKVITPRFIQAVIVARFPQDSSWGAVEFSPDGSAFALGEPDTVSLWDARTGLALAKVPRTYSPGYLEFSPDGRSLLVPTHNDSAELLDVATGSVAKGYRFGRNVYAAYFSPTEPLLVAASLDSLSFRSSATGLELGRMPIRGGEAVFSPDGSLLAQWSDSIRIIDVATRAVLKAMPKNPPGVTSANIAGLRFSPDGSSIHVMLREQAYMRVSVATGEILKTYKIDNIPERAVFTSDGLRVAIGTWNRGILIRDVETGALIRDLTAGLKIGPVQAMDFSPDKRHLLTWSFKDGMATLWDIGQP